MGQSLTRYVVPANALKLALIDIPPPERKFENPKSPSTPSDHGRALL